MLISNYTAGVFIKRCLLLLVTSASIRVCVCVLEEDPYEAVFPPALSAPPINTDARTPPALKKKQLGESGLGVSVL